MQTYPECVPCIVRLVLSTVEHFKLDRQAQLKIMKQSLEIIHESILDIPPTVIAGHIFKALQEHLGEQDLYLDLKKGNTKQALELYPILKALVDNATDPFDMAIRISAMGNLMDVANPNSYDLDIEIRNIHQQFWLGHAYEEFKARMSKAKNLLVLGDNAGETVFDRVFLEQLEIPVIYAVKGGPAFNDATLEDAQDARLHSCAKLITTGKDYPGTYLPYCSREFRRVVDESPLILAKGQGNFETLSNEGEKIFFLLKVKCDAVSRETGLPIGSIAFLQGKSTNS